MKREIKFRGLRVDGKGWVYSECIIKENVCEQKEDPHGEIVELNCKDTVSLFDNKAWYFVEPESVGQFTGLKDKNGTEIYEGDVLNTSDNTSIKIEWVSDRIETYSHVNVGYSFYGYSSKDVVVVGNIHE